MLTHRLKILASMLIAIILVEGYTYFSQNPTVIPIQAENIKGLLANIKFNPASLTRLFTLQFSDNNNLAQVQPYESTHMNGLNNGPVPTYIPPTKIIKPTGLINQTPTLVQPTPDDGLVDFPFEPGDVDNLGGAPTNDPKPTKAPKPTKTPTPPPIKTDLRPGTNLKEIFSEVNKRACFPPALLMAFKTVETGERFKNDTATTIKIYNTYGWWITGAGDPCYGYGYYTQSGIVPPDSVSAGSSCNSPIGDPTDLKIMGITQISEWEQEVAQKYISSTIPKNDRRVLFDNALIFAYITRSRVGDPPKDCNSWPDDMVRLAAEKHLGSGCQYYYSQNGASGDYCKEILDLYKQYKKEGF